jgi:hypothetical protein
MNWSIALSTSAVGLDLALTYEDTNLDEADALWLRLGRRRSNLEPLVKVFNSSVV